MQHTQLWELPTKMPSDLLWERIPSVWLQFCRFSAISCRRSIHSYTTQAGNYKR